MEREGEGGGIRREKSEGKREEGKRRMK